MRPSYVGVTAALLLCGCSCSKPPTVPEPPASDSADPKYEPPLAAYVDADLRKLPESRKAELKKLLAANLPGEQCEGPFSPPEPWAIWKTSVKGSTGYILFEGCHMVVIPSGSHAFVHFFDGAGKHTKSFQFSTGWRIDIYSAALRTDPALKGQLIEVSSGPAGLGRDVSRQIYGIIDDRVALLWLEDSDGTMVANTYDAPNHQIGPQVPNRTAEEWERALESDQPMVVLEALTWIGGEHRGLAPVSYVAEDLETARLVAAVRQRPGVRKKIEALTRSEVNQVRQAAKLALEGFPTKSKPVN